MPRNSGTQELRYRVTEPLFTPRFAGVWLFAFVTFFSAFQLLPAIPFRILELGGSKAEAGWFLAVYTFASAFSAPLTGTIADHIGRRRLLTTASVLFIGFSLAYGVIRSLPLLWVVGAIHGVLWSGLLTSSSAIMSELIPESRRTEGLAYWGLASIMAIAAAPPVGLYVAHWGWPVLCGELALLSCAMSVASMLLPDVGELVTGTRPRFSEAWDWKVIATALSLTVASFGYGGVTSFVAILSVERHIEPKSLYFTVFAITIVFVRVFTSRLGDKYGTKTVLYPSLAAIPIAFFLLASAFTRPQLVTSAILFGFGFGGSYPAFATFILSNTDPKRRARTFGSILWAFDTGIGSGSIIVGVIGHHGGLGLGFTVAAILSCLAIPIFAWTSKGLQRGTAVASTDGHG